MKKVLYAFILIMSSFFFCECVLAATREYTITDEEIGYVSSDDFKIVRAKAIEYSQENNLYYRIAYFNSSLKYTIYFYPKDEYKLKYSTSYGLYLYPSVAKTYISYVDGIFTDISESSKSYEKLLYGTTITYYNFLDTNFDNFILDYAGYDKNFEFLIYYKDTSYSFLHNSNFKSVYDLYSEYNNITDEPEISEPEINKPEYSVISNFYTLTIEKINLFANSIIQNFTFLFVIVILILIFLIELIRRYLL